MLKQNIYENYRKMENFYIQNINCEINNQLSNRHDIKRITNKEMKRVTKYKRQRQT